MKRLAAVLPAVLVLAGCAASVEEAADEPAAAGASPLVLAAATPAGATRAADGSAAFAVRGGELLRFDPATGERTGSWDLPGRWRLGGVSANGRWVGLTRPGTKILVLDASDGRIAHELDLAGDFVVETISAAGDFLFLQQNFVDGGYAVRGYDLARGQMLPGSLGTKGETVKMYGRAGQVVASPDGRWLLTVYVDTKAHAAFVHALDLVDRQPRCIVLPPCEDCTEDELSRWTLRLGRDGRTAEATNPALGRTAEIDLATGAVVF